MKVNIKKVILVSVVGVILCLGMYIYIPRHIEFNIMLTELDKTTNELIINETTTFHTNIYKKNYLTKQYKCTGTVKIGDETFKLNNSNEGGWGFGFSNDYYIGEALFNYNVDDLSILVYHVYKDERFNGMPLKGKLYKYWRCNISDIDASEVKKLREDVLFSYK